MTPEEQTAFNANPPKITLINSDHERFDISPKDIIGIVVNGKSVFITGASIIIGLIESENWNTPMIDAKTGEKFTVTDYIKTQITN